jgi:very-short-patch-repair endonuclease
MKFEFNVDYNKRMWAERKALWKKHPELEKEYKNKLRYPRTDKQLQVSGEVFKRNWKNKAWKAKKNKQSSELMRRQNADPVFRAKQQRAVKKAKRQGKYKRAARRKGAAFYFRTGKLGIASQRKADPNFTKHAKARMKKTVKVLKELLKNPEYRSRHAEICTKNLRGCAHYGNTPSKTQLVLYRRLKKLGIKCLALEWQVGVGKYSLDIAHLATKTDIESDGAYWHGMKPEHDEVRDALLKRKGWKVIRLILNSKKEAKKVDLTRLLRRLMAA